MNIYTFENLSLLLELTGYVRDGVELYIGDKPSTPEKVIDMISVHDDGIEYMPDYIKDEHGDLIRIRYDRVCEK